MFEWTRRPKVNHPAAPSFYHYRPGYHFTPGAGGFVFEPKYSLPPIFFRGNGRLVNGSFNVVAPQIWNVVAKPQQGIGIMAGQLVFSPLVDTSGNGG